LIFLPLAVALANLTALPVKDDARETVAPLAAIQLDQNTPPIDLIIQIGEHSVELASLRSDQVHRMLAYLDDEVYRRRMLIQLNRGERRHSLARVIFHGQRGEVRQRYRQGQEDQLGALGLVLNCVVLWNTRYLDAAVTHLKAQGRAISDDDLARLSPFMHRHVNVHGRYSFAVPEEVQRGELRPLRDLATIDNLEDV
jgi:TnpA family transposase